MFIYLCIYFYIFLNSFLVFFFEDHIGNKCAVVCFNVSILGKYYIYMYYNVLPNKLTHSHITCPGEVCFGRVKRQWTGRAGTKVEVPKTKAY